MPTILRHKSNPHLNYPNGESGSQFIARVRNFFLSLLEGHAGQTVLIVTHNGVRKCGKHPVDLAQQMERLGAGEIVINSIDNDGVMKGYDVSLAEKIRGSITVPLTIIGGAGSLHDVSHLISTFGPIGSAAGSLFVFKGVYRAVLVNYPNRIEKDALINENVTI